jgi:hypothetical protein
VLEIDRKVERDHRERDRDPRRQLERVHQAEAVRFPGERDHDGSARHEQPHDRHVDDEQRDVVRPTRAALEGAAAPWRNDFPQRHREENREERPEPDQRLGLDASVGAHRAPTSSRC